MFQNNSETFSFNKLSRGPLGLGDPEDKSLRKVEKEVLIPKIIRERSKELKCSEFKKEFDDCCMNGNPMFIVTRCREQNRKFQQCMNYWFNNEEFVKECTEIYLKRRTEYRTNGIKDVPKRKTNRNNSNENSNNQ